jgi:hypothetical protein
MEKTFTVNVPDDLWVDAWTENKTTDYTYNGPATLHVVVRTIDGFDIVSWGETAPTAINEDIEQVVELDANTDTGVAWAMIHEGDDWDYTYTTITNHDDSTHEETNNPKLTDIYEAVWSPNDGFALAPIYKETETMAERTAKERKSYVVKYDDAYDFDADTQAVIDQFKTDMDAYLATMATAYPWRYVTIDHSAIPKVPASLVATFNTLPDIV